MVESFRDYVAAANPRYQWYRHCDIMADVLERVVTGELTRVMFFLPPRHTKSETVSRLFSGYYLLRHPERWVGLNSYADALAYTLSRNARENYRAAGGTFSQGAEAVKHWETHGGGGMWAAGVGGPITGKGFHLGIIDDPLKNAEEASSEVIREKQKDWYRSTFLTRQEPNAAIIIIQTRWHEDDLSGWLLAEEEAGGEYAEKWHIVRMEAIKDDEAEPIPATCTLEPDFRFYGEALCPERYDLRKLQAMRNRLGSYYFAALYQQTPRAREGNFFKRGWFEIVNEVPYQAERVRWWDKAATVDAGDYTAGVLMAKANGIYYVEDVVRGQWSSNERDAIIRQTAAMDSERYHGRVRIWSEQEPGSSGKDSAAAFVQMLSVHPARTEPSTGNKSVRADPFAAQAEAGNVKLKSGLWNTAYMDELMAFPNGKYDDQVDGSSGAFNKLALSKTVKATSA